jgi:hypothetical protein
MVNLEQLGVRGLRAYEAGRARAASRIALFLIPAAAVCLVESRGREACACLAAVLLGLAFWLRWRDRQSLESVTSGLLAGSIPLVAGLALERLDLPCTLAGASTFCTAFAVLVGGVAGVIIGIREIKWRGRFWSWLTAGTIAALAASLGCVRLGAVGFASVVGGIALGTVAMAVIARQST